MFSCTQRTDQGKDSELILTFKMETRHFVGGPYDREISAFVIIAELWRPEVAKSVEFLEQFLRFFGKTTHNGKIFKILFRKFTWRHRWTLLCSNVVKSVRREIGEIVRYVPHRNTNFGSLLSLLRGSHSKSVRASPWHLAHSVPKFVQMGSLSAEL